MQMKQKIVSLALAAALLISVPVSAFATAKFNQGVFDGRDNIIVERDDMAGTSEAYTQSWLNGDTITPLDPSMATVQAIDVSPRIILSDSYDFFLLRFEYYETGLSGLNGFIIKIGDNRYSFSNCYTTKSIIANGVYCESVGIYMKKETLDFMKDLADHQNDEIHVRLNGSIQNVDFVLSDAAKDSLLELYDLYTSGGGTREVNMCKISDFDPVRVEKNGKKVIGNVLPIIMYGLSQAL